MRAEVPLVCRPARRGRRATPSRAAEWRVRRGQPVEAARQAQARLEAVQAWAGRRGLRRRRAWVDKEMEARAPAAAHREARGEATSRAVRTVSLTRVRSSAAARRRRAPT